MGAAGCGAVNGGSRVGNALVGAGLACCTADAGAEGVVELVGEGPSLASHQDALPALATTAVATKLLGMRRETVARVTFRSDDGAAGPAFGTAIVASVPVPGLASGDDASSCGMTMVVSPSRGISASAMAIARENSSALW